jgi:hypothetical protein
MGFFAAEEEHPVNIRGKLLVLAALALACIAASSFSTRVVANDHGQFRRFRFAPGTLVLSRSVYVGTTSSVTVGQVLPPNCVPGPITLPTLAGGTTTVTIKANSSSACNAAVADGTYPTVFNNDTADGSFGITSPIFLDNITDDGFRLDTLPIPTDEVVTSFSSKSELALHLSTDHKSITFVAYRGGPGFVTGPNQLDVSNSNTPGVIDPSNPVSSQYFRAVAEIFADGSMQFTEGNAYSGNNGRAAIKAHGLYYLTGNDNNGGLNTKQLTTTQVGINLITSTGVELLVPGQAPPVPPNINMIGDFSVTSVGQPADKPGKDNNFRGITIFNDTLYVTKGSGGNGINTVYQVGNPVCFPPAIPPLSRPRPLPCSPASPARTQAPTSTSPLGSSSPTTTLSTSAMKAMALSFRPSTATWPPLVLKPWPASKSGSSTMAPGPWLTSSRTD